jgi:hypothetical protein
MLKVSRGLHLPIFASVCIYVTPSNFTDQQYFTGAFLMLFVLQRKPRPVAL